MWRERRRSDVSMRALPDCGLHHIHDLTLRCSPAWASLEGCATARVAAILRGPRKERGHLRMRIYVWRRCYPSNSGIAKSSQPGTSATSENGLPNGRVASTPMAEAVRM